MVDFTLFEDATGVARDREGDMPVASGGDENLASEAAVNLAFGLSGDERSQAVGLLQKVRDVRAMLRVVRCCDGLVFRATGTAAK